MEKLSPIIVFAFNRPQHLKNTIESLLKNSEAAASDLHIFVDGARSDKAGELELVKSVQEYVTTIEGFRSVHHKFSSHNKGLGPSVIAGVSEVINQYGSAIILEDDLIVASNFLSYMNEGLQRYADKEDVFSICGYTNLVKKPSDYPANTYFCTRSSSWGWGTWADRWNSIDWELNDWDRHQSNRSGFNRWGGSDCFGMLEGWKTGKNRSWAIRFCYAQFLQDKLSLFPITSMVNNDGFDGAGTNCKKYSRFKFEFDTSGDKEFTYPDSTEMNRKLYKQAMSYHSIPKRIVSRIMYMLDR